MRQQLPHAPAFQNCRKAELKARCLGIPQGSSPLWVGIKQGSSVWCPPHTSISPLSSRRKERRNPPHGCCYHRQLHKDVHPLSRVSSKGTGHQQRRSVPRKKEHRVQGGEILTCFVVSPLLGLSSPSDLVSLTTLRAASSLVSLPEKREQCRQKQIAAEKPPLTPTTAGGRQCHGPF